MSKIHDYNHRWIIIGLVVFGIISDASCHLLHSQLLSHIGRGPKYNPQRGNNFYQSPDPKNSSPGQYEIVKGTFDQLGLDMAQWKCTHRVSGKEIIFALPDQNGNNINNNINGHQNGRPQYTPESQQPGVPSYNPGPQQQPGVPPYNPGPQQQPGVPPYNPGPQQQPGVPPYNPGPQQQPGVPPYNPGPQQQPGIPQNDPSSRNPQSGQNPGYVPVGPSTIPMPGLPGIPNQPPSVPTYTTTEDSIFNSPNFNWEDYVIVTPAPSYDGQGVIEPRLGSSS